MVIEGFAMPKSTGIQDVDVKAANIALFALTVEAGRLGGPLVQRYRLLPGDEDLTFERAGVVLSGMAKPVACFPAKGVGTLFVTCESLSDSVAARHRYSRESEVRVLRARLKRYAGEEENPVLELRGGGSVLQTRWDAFSRWLLDYSLGGTFVLGPADASMSDQAATVLVEFFEVRRRS